MLEIQYLFDITIFAGKRKKKISFTNFEKPLNGVKPSSQNDQLLDKRQFQAHFFIHPPPELLPVLGPLE